MDSGRKNREALLDLAEILKHETGISLQGLREELVHARLNRRMKTLGVKSFDEYVSCLRSAQGDRMKKRNDFDRLVAADTAARWM